MRPCPCGSGKSLQQCCQPYLRGDAFAPTAAALMRSRYSAYVLEETHYLLATWHPDTRPQQLQFEDGITQPKPKWIGLTIKHFLEHDDQHAEVEFIARYKINGRAFKMHEVSQFTRIADRWFYRDGAIS